MLGDQILFLNGKLILVHILHHELIVNVVMMQAVIIGVDSTAAFVFLQV
jgi:hypothetical protein